ncbi:uncharacterized protein LOC131019530 isoform X2 [Salvia miltiorrhiza]|nr:uncharacterized protein LOC131019530 isoform X2 [Salvia miltiorrhiza]
MKGAFSGTDLKGVPHINSKICTWKKNYNNLLLILKFSGTGFNVHGDHMVDVTNEQLEQITKRDSNAKNMRYKSWSMLETRKEVFGKDRATSDNVEDLMDVVTNMYHCDTTRQNIPDGDYHVNLEDVMENEVIEESASQCKRSEATTTNAKKKRKQRDELENVYGLLGEISRNAIERMKELTTHVGYEFDIGQARKTVFEHVSLIPGLTLEEIFDVTELLAYKVERLEIFMGLSPEARIAYAMRLLQGKNK